MTLSALRRTAVRYAHTVRHLRFEQIAWRIYLRIKRYAYQKVGLLNRASQRRVQDVAERLVIREPRVFRFPDPCLWYDMEQHLQIADAAREFKFRFLNVPAQFKGQIDWHSDSHSHLWRYNLQYQAYLVSLGVAYRVTQDPKYYQAFQRIVEDWIRSNPCPYGDGWHPYPVSLRVVNWLMAFSLFEPALDADASFRMRYQQSLVEHLDYVARFLEHDVAGNHLIENIKALCLGGIFFSGPDADRWLRLGVALLKGELKRQVLPDEGHYERSPMYHAIVLQDLLLLAYALSNGRMDPPDDLVEAIKRMVRFYAESLHPDGEIPLFNDSAFGVAAPPDALFRLASAVLGPSELTDRAPQKPTLYSHSHSGYYSVLNMIVVDAGPVCPDDLPAHAHADIFSYELSIHGRRWIVDSGVREYASGAWRDYARSSRAHNTVVVNGQNQVDVWSSFRVGRRVKPKNVYIHHSDDVTVIAGRHEGFGRNAVHQRIVVDFQGQAWLFIDEVSGTGKAEVENFIHFHPDVQVRPEATGARLYMDGDEVGLLTCGFSELTFIRGQTEPLNGWYMPEFGLAQENTVAVGRNESLPTFTAYLITMNPVVAQLKLHSSDKERRCLVSLGSDQNWEISWSQDNLKPVVERK